MISVLYVDDESELLEIGKLFLEQSTEFSVDTSSSAIEALTLLQQKKYDAVLSDYQMPGMDGIRFLQTLRGRGDMIPFIIFTGRGREEVIIEALNSGVDFFLQKGGDPTSQFAELKNIISKSVRQKRAEEAQRQYEKRIHDILNHLPDSTFAIDRSGHVIAWNRAIEDMTGVPAAEMLGKGNYEYAIPFYGERRPILIDLIFENINTIESHYVNVQRNGNILVAETYVPGTYHGKGAYLWGIASPFYDTDENIIGAIESIRDITERKKADDELRAAYEQITGAEEELREQFEELGTTETALRNSERRLQGIVYGSPIPQFVIDKNHKVISWNSALERYSGVKADDVIGTTDAWRAFYPEKRPVMADLLVDNTLDKIPVWYAGKYSQSKYIGGAFEAVDIFPGMGEHGIWLYFTASPLRDAENNIIGAVETLEDITEIKENEEALRVSEAKYRTILENIQDVYYRSDVDGNLILASPSMATVLGYDSLTEVYEKNISRTFYYNPEERTQFLEDINRSGSIANYEVTLKKRDGTPVFVLTSSHKYYNDSGTFQGIEGIFRDITGRRKTEDELRRAYEQITAAEEELRAQFEELKYGQDALSTSEKKLQGIVQGSPIPQFVIDKNHRVISWNSALERYSGIQAGDVLGTNQQWKAFYPQERPCMADLLVDGTINKIPEWYSGKYNTSKYVDGAFEATDFFPKMGAKGKWLFFTASVLRDTQGESIGAVETLEDITEVKEKEAALKASEDQFRNVVETQTEFICRFLPDGTHVFVNEAYCKYFGKKCSDLIGTKFKPVIPPEDEHKVQEHFASFSRENPVSTIDHRIVMADGSLRWQRWVDRAIFDEHGTIVEYQTVGRDITDIKRGEMALRESENQYRSLFYENYSVSLLIDPESGMIVEANTAACDYYGYPLKTLTAMGIYDINRLPKKNVLRDLKAAISKKEKHFFTTHFLASGEERNVEVYSGPITVTGRPLFFSVIHDVTDRKRAEQALRESESQLNAIIQGSPIPQFVINENHRIIHWNRALEKYSGILADDVIGTTQQWRAFYPSEHPCMADLLVDDKIDSLLQWYAGKIAKSALIKSGYEATDFFPHMGQSGTWLFFTAAQIRNSRGTIIGAVETLEDVTDTKRKEEALSQVNKKLNLMSSVTRHDILNQLTAVSGFLELLKERISGKEERAYLLQEETAVRNIEDQITFTSAYQDIGVNNPEWQNIADIIRHADSQLPRGSVLLDTDLGDIEVYADPLMVKVFYNLIDNSLRYGEKITRIGFFYRETEEELVLFCEDDGAGVPAGDKDRIFERGFGRHSGFGLFLAREILSITGLTIRETGEPGKGARFEIHVPKNGYRQIKKTG